MTTSLPADEPIVNLAGDLVALGPVRRDLLPVYQRWMNDWAAVRNLGVAPRPMTLEAETAWFDGLGGAADVEFTIYERATMRPIGNTGLHQIDHRNRTAEFGIFIGEADARGQGYGTETTRLMLDYAFTGLGLHSLFLRVYAFNPAGIRAYEKAGFQECGRRREAVFMGGRMWDLVMMDCLATGFTSPVVRRMFGLDSAK